MRSLIVLTLMAIMLCWTTSALASGYAALDDDAGGLHVGAGALLIHGKNASGGQQSVTIPTINLGALTDAWAWQVFYSVGNGPTVIGGAADYILADNFDAVSCDCSDGIWWFGAGPSVIHLEDIFASAAGVNLIGESINEGVNVGAGWSGHDWDIEGRAHYLFQDKMVVIQATVSRKF